MIEEMDEPYRNRAFKSGGETRHTISENSSTEKNGSVFVGFLEDYYTNQLLLTVSYRGNKSKKVVYAAFNILDLLRRAIKDRFIEDLFINGDFLDIDNHCELLQIEDRSEE